MSESSQPIQGTITLRQLQAYGISAQLFPDLDFSVDFPSFYHFVKDVTKYVKTTDPESLALLIKSASVLSHELHSDAVLKKEFKELKKIISQEELIAGDPAIIGTIGIVLLGLLSISWSSAKKVMDAAIDEWAAKNLQKKFRLTGKQALIMRAILKRVAKKDEIKELLREFME